MILNLSVRPRKVSSKTSVAETRIERKIDISMARTTYRSAKNGSLPSRTNKAVKGSLKNERKPSKRRNTQREEDNNIEDSIEKRQKIGPHLSERQSKLAQTIADFNLAINELFYLKEFKSLIYWKPTEFSRTTSQVPEIYEYFIDNSDFHLSWDDESSNKEIENLSFRFQKKALREKEERLKQKFPFKDDILNLSNQIEKETVLSLSKPLLFNDKHFLNTIDKTRTLKPKKTTVANGETSVMHARTEDITHSDNLSDNEVGQHKFKSVRFSIPPSIITHPSHIPKWVPDQKASSSPIIQSTSSPIDYHPQKIEIIRTKDTSYLVPDIRLNLHNFLEKTFKSAIVDDANQEYGNTPEEYEAILLQQKRLMKNLYDQIFVTKRLELHGDKVEKRRTVLPHSSNAKQAMDPFRNNGMVTPKPHNVQLASSTHEDYFISQAVSFSKIHQQVRKQHQLRVRKIAQMIDSHFKKKRGEKERMARERELNTRKLSRMAAQAVKKRWSQATKVYNFLQLQRQEELKKIKGREHLSQMLEHSTQLLEAQLHKTKREGSGSDSQESSSDFGDSMDSESDDADDMKLTVEQLKNKYAHLNKFENSNSSKSSVSSSQEIDDNDGLLSLYDGKLFDNKPTFEIDSHLEYTDDQKKLIEKFSQEERKIQVLDSDADSDSLTGSDLDSDSESSLDSGSGSGSEPEFVSDSGSRSRGSPSPQVDSDTTSKSFGIKSKESLKTEDLGLKSLLGKLDDNDEEEIMNNLSEYETNEGPDTDKSAGQNPRKSYSGDSSKTSYSSEEKVEEVNGSKVRDVEVPELLTGHLRPYQKQGLNWLASLYNNNTNGILADEMGLGKTIQTIALLAYLACEHHIWGPHLIIVPTSVMLNWEMEFKKFAPGFKVLTYYGSPQQRAQKRKGWNKPDAFHVCITSYQLVVQDQQSFKRRKWRYMILDEAHNIKNFRSARWKALLNFNTENRLLLTGTPLQNNLMELWSLLYFLMPSSKVNQAMPDGFADLEDFQAWFGRPVDKILEMTSHDSGDVVGDNDTLKKMDLETRSTVSRLHQVLRPYILRRLKKDVETQMPAKYEHIIYCRLSKRQRYLYDDFMSRAKTKETLASGNYLSIINCLMQLRKVCNHPDLFEVRPIVTSFAMQKGVCSDYLSTELTVKRLLDPFTSYDSIDLQGMNLDITAQESLNTFTSSSISKLKSSIPFDKDMKTLENLIEDGSRSQKSSLESYIDFYKHVRVQNQMTLMGKLEQIKYINDLRCSRHPRLGESLIEKLSSISRPNIASLSILEPFVLSLSKRAEIMREDIEKFAVITPSVVALDMKDQLIPLSTRMLIEEEVEKGVIHNPFHFAQVKLSIAFPDKSLLQYDCGKLQKLTLLLHDLTSKGHRALIFTQMTKVLDILEQFLNIHGYRYMRLDGATKIEDRQIMTERFNRDPKIPVFILSTRSGGLGINLTGADTVIFYDSDWNPAMDKQCQDRCHRIGQSRDVHIYRFVSEYTIESNILKKANQKRHLDNVVIQEGEFTTDYFGKFSIKDLVTGVNASNPAVDKPLSTIDGNIDNLLAQAEDEDDREAANAAMKEVALDQDDFADESKSNTATATQTPRQSSVMEDEVYPTTKTNNNEDLDYESVGHVDEYMLRFIANGYFGD